MVALPLAATAGLIWVLTFSSEGVLARLETLTEANPSEVYYRNRGIFVEDTVENLMLEYPAGAGLGRWGMMAYYFGGTSAKSLHAEIQMTGWLYDGGILMVIAGYAALALACTFALKTALRHPDSVVADYAGLMFGYNIGSVAVTFNYPLFISQGGLEFWLLNAALATAASCRHARVATTRQIASA